MKKTMKNSIYNKSSENMSEIEDGIVDLVVTSPPYTVGSVFGDFVDDMVWEDYAKLMTNVIAEIYRVLGDKGLFILEAADTIYSRGNYIQLAGFLQSLAIEEGFFLVSRHYNLSASKDGVELAEGGKEESYVGKASAHSNTHQFMVFSKQKKDYSPGKILHFDYVGEKEHSCPFPDKTIQFVLDTYFSARMLVLDPFAGIAPMAKEVRVRGGNFIGYEIDKNIAEIARQRMTM